MTLLAVGALLVLAVGACQAETLRGVPENQSHERRLSFTFSSSCNWNDTPPFYVDIATGKNQQNGYGLTLQNPYKTIQYAIDQRQPCQTIYVVGGEYKNNYFGQSKNHQNKVVNLNGVTDLKLLAYAEANRPILKFDGPGGIMGGFPNTPIANIEIAGFEIVGPSEGINYPEAYANRLNNRSYYKGRGIAIWAGHHIYIHDNIVHHCPASGIRVNRGDYITIASNVVHSNTWWSPSAESAIVLAASKHIDQTNGFKMVLTKNIVHQNMNKIPYYNPNYVWDYSPIAGGIDCSSYTACQNLEIENCPWQCRYGKVSQDYIIDGMGVYVTRNNDSYLYGQMELSENICYENGINGVGFHRTDRGTIKKNLVFDNGVVQRLEKNEPNLPDWQLALGKSRQPYSGITINNALEVKLWSNGVKARYDDDYAYVQLADGAPTPIAAGGNNKVCEGLVNIDPSSMVTSTNDDTKCGLGYVEIACGDNCHLIQWPYNMGQSYDGAIAETNCANDCDNGDCKAFSLQKDYRPTAPAGNLWCFLYKASEEPSPSICADDPFNNGQCTYGTQDGQFFITSEAKLVYNVQGI